MASTDEKNSLDKEILEIEILIGLQMRKLELLREKNASLSSPVGTERSSHPPTSFQETQNPIKLSRYGPAGIEMTKTKKTEDSGSSNNGSSGTDALQKLSSVSSNLANERTLLAFIRTSLAIGRTMVAFMGLTSFSHYGHFMLSFAPMSFAIVAVICLSIGIFRYFVIKDLINNLKLVQVMPRLSSNYIVPSSCLLVLLMAMVATLANEWEKSKSGLEY